MALEKDNLNAANDTGKESQKIFLRCCRVFSDMNGAALNLNLSYKNLRSRHI